MVMIAQVSCCMVHILILKVEEGREPPRREIVGEKGTKKWL